MVQPLGYKPVQHVTVLNTAGNCNTMGNIIILYYNIMGPPSYMRSVVDRNVVLRCIPVFPIYLSLFHHKLYSCFHKSFRSTSDFLVLQFHPVQKYWDSCSEQVSNPYPTAFPYGNGMLLHFYQQQESSTTKTVHKVINKGLKTYV